jgi:hypothetical protein
MEKKIINSTGYSIIIACMLLLVVSCKKDNNNSDNSVALGSGGPLTFMPTSGDAGTLVTINGSGFSTNAADDLVTFNGVPANVVSTGSTQLVVQSPQGGNTGDIEISVNGKKVTVGTYTYQTLSIHSVTPVNGPTGTNIQIRGAGFGSTTSPAQVTVNGAPAIVTSVTDTLLVAAVPANAGTGVVVVTVNGKTATGPIFTYQAISQITPASGGAGTIVTIHGTGFSTTATQNVVAFNGVSAVVKSATDSLIVATAPKGVATGPVSVSINGERTVGPVFTVVPLPAITSLAPSSGPVGATVTITGTNFSSILAENQVSFNGVPAVISSATNTNLIVTVPKGAATGNVTVTTNNQKSLGSPFSVQSLGISLLTPNNGLDGTVVVITGTGFSTNPAQDIVNFTGSTVPAKITAATATQLTVTVPTGSASGVVTVKVNNLKATGPAFTHSGVITLAGGPSTGLISGFPGCITVDPNGNVYVSDNNHIIKITPSGATSYIGSPTGAGGLQDGSAATALFSNPQGLTSDSQGNIFVADNGNQVIREIAPDGTVSTYKSNLGIVPYGVRFDGNGLLYINDYSNIYKYLANGLRTTITPNGSGYLPFALDASGSAYFGGSICCGDGTIGKYNAVTGTAADFAGTRYQAAFVDGPFGTGKINSVGGMDIDPTTQNAIFADGGSNAIRQVTAATGVLTTLTGGSNFTGARGYQDGALSTALFNNPVGVAVGKNGVIYVLERGNEDVREIATH